jgi:hypothetical protein
MIHWIKQNKESIIRIAFLIPILSVAIISISHVVSWYNLANPLSWAIYLSVAIEVAALSSIAAASVKVKGFSVWFVFIIVTLIQFIGNIYFSYTEININSKEFKDWAELTFPLFDSFSDTADLVSQRRLLAILEGGLLPLISLTCLHFFIKYGDRDSQESEPIVSGKIVEPIKSDESKRVWEKVKELREEGKLPVPTEEDLADEPTALANSQYRNEEPMIEDNVIFIDESQIIESPKDPIERKEVTGGVSLTKGPMSSNNKLRRQ